MKIVFIGSGLVACPALRRLAASCADDIALVITQPDRPCGRGRHPAPCALKQTAEDLGLPVLTPEKIGEPIVLQRVGALQPDLIIVAAYGQFLPRALLDIPSLGAINIHPSLLPRYRGAAPIQWSLIHGDTVTGVTIMYMVERMDAGDMIRQVRVPIDPEDDAGALEARLAEEGAALLMAVVDDLRRGRIDRTPQCEEAVVFAPRLRKEDGRLDLTRPAGELVNRVRGLYPWPCACIVPEGEGLPLRILKAREESGQGTPGIVLDVNADGPLVATGHHALRLLRVQPPGKPPMSGRDFCNGHRIHAGAGIVPGS